VGGEDTAALMLTGATATTSKLQVRDDVTDALINRAPVLTVDGQ